MPLTVLFSFCSAQHNDSQMTRLLSRSAEGNACSTRLGVFSDQLNRSCLIGQVVKRSRVTGSRCELNREVANFTIRNQISRNFIQRNRLMSAIFLRLSDKVVTLIGRTCRIQIQISNFLAGYVVDIVNSRCSLERNLRSARTCILSDQGDRSRLNGQRLKCSVMPEAVVNSRVSFVSALPSS